RARVSERMQPGVVYTTFHFPESGANVITTDNSDWATNCPEYKVTPVHVSLAEQPSAWQAQNSEFRKRQDELLRSATAGWVIPDEYRDFGAHGQSDRRVLRADA